MKKSKILPHLAVMFVMILLVAGCPQTPEEETEETKTYKIYSEAAMDGSIVWSGASDYTVYSSDASINIGDYDDGVVTVETTTRGFFSFNLSSIPAGSDIKSAVVRIYQNSNISGDPYSAAPAGLGNVTIGVVSYTVFDATVPVVNGNWNAADIATLSTSFTANTWHTLNVTSQLNDELDTYMTGRLQFIIRHTQENNNDGPPADSGGWTSGDSLTNRPELVVTVKK